MKIKKLLLILGLCLLGLSIYAKTPIGIWTNVGGNPQRTGQNLRAHDLDYEKLNVEWMYPLLTENADYYIKTIDEAICGPDWIDSLGSTTIAANPDRIRSENAVGQKHFKYAVAHTNNEDISSCDFVFAGLAPGEKYQAFLTVPSDLTLNVNEYNICNRAFVRLHYQNADGLEVNDYYPVNMSYEKYAGTWMYVTQYPITVGPDGAIVISITDYGTYTTPFGEINPYEGNPAIVLADACRIVRITNKETTGSSVAAAYTSDDLIYDFTNGNVPNFNGLEYNPCWKFTSKSGMFVKNKSGNDVFWGLVSQLNRTSDKIFVLAPDSGASPDYSKFSYNFKVSESGHYDLYVDTVTFSSGYSNVDGNSYYNLQNYATQKYNIYCGDSLVGTREIDMSKSGWQSLGEFSLTADTNCSIVLCPGDLSNLTTTPVNIQGDAPKAYVAGAIRVTRSKSDNERTPVVISCFRNPIKETPVGRFWSDTFIDACSLKYLGNIDAFNPWGSGRYWSFGGVDNYANWEPLEGPISNGFVNTPILTYVSDNGVKRLAAFVGDHNGIVYAFDLAADTNSRLLFKGPGIFLSEPIEGGGTSIYPDYDKVSANVAHGGSYLSTTNNSADFIPFKITDLMREEAGDNQIYNETTSGDYYSKQYSQWKWKVRFWVPPIPNIIGTEYKFVIKSHNWNTGKTVSDTKYSTITSADLGTWKYVDYDISYSGISEVDVCPNNIPSGKEFAVDNIWICPALPSGEELTFGENCDFTTDNERYNFNGVCKNLDVSKLFAQTEEGRLFAYDLTDINFNNKIGKILWTYPKLEDRKYDLSNVTPSYIGSKIYMTMRDLNTYNWSTVSLEGDSDKSAFVRDELKAVNDDADIINFYDDPNYSLETQKSGFMNYLGDNKTGKVFTYTVLNNGVNVKLNKLVHSNNADSTIESKLSDTIASNVETTPCVASYGNVLNPSEKILFNDITGKVYSYEINGSGTMDTPTSNFTSLAVSDYVDHVVSNIVTDGYIDANGNLSPRGYFGGNDGYMSVFDAVNGIELRKIFAGKLEDEGKKLIKASPAILDGLDFDYESIVNLNGSDGYNYTYAQNVYYYDTKRWRDALAYGSNWEELLKEEGAEVIDPSNINEDYAQIQVEVLDWKTANNLIDIIKNKNQADSLYKKLRSDEKTVLDTIPNNTKSFITKNMLVIPLEMWKYILTGGVGNPTDNKIDTEEKVNRLKNYLLLEALKIRNNLKFDGSEVGEPGVLMWKTDSKTGESKPRQDGKNLVLEWGDHIYLAIWNMGDEVNIAGTQAAIFEYGGGNVLLSERKVHEPTRRIPASVTNVYAFEPYNVKFENPFVLGNTPTNVQINNKYLKKKLVILDCVLDCNRNKVQTMIGDGWTLCVDLVTGGAKASTLRYPISNLVKGNINTEDPNLCDLSGNWLVAGDRRENFSVNNPLSAKIKNKAYGPTYTRFDSNNRTNGVNDDDVVTVNLGDFNHNFLTNLQNVAKVANRSEINISNLKVSPSNHTIGSNNFLGNYKPYPWEYGTGSVDYPYISSNDVIVTDNDDEDLTSVPRNLNAIKPWINSENAYYSNRDGNVDFNNSKACEIGYQVDIPRYQPAMKNYIADVYVYIDSNGNGKFDRTGSLNAPALNCEPYRRFKVTFDVRPKPEMFVEEDDIYFGEAGHGLGYPLGINGIFTPYYMQALGLKGNVSYNPYNKKPEIMRWYKSFKVYNDGNVNLYDLSLNKEPLYAKFANDNMSTYNENIVSSANSYGMSPNMLRIQENNVVSSLDSVLYSDLTNGGSSRNFGALYPVSSNKENFDAGAGRTFTITKPRVGDLDSAPLTIPDSKKITGRSFSANGDYNRLFNNTDFDLDIRDALNPMISVAVPIGQPIGEYGTRHPITVSAKYGDNKTISSNNGINLNIDVTSNQITGIPYDKKTAKASLYGVPASFNGAATYYSFGENADATPMGFIRNDNSIGIVFSDDFYAKNHSSFSDDDNMDAPRNLAFGELRNTLNVENTVAGLDDNNYYSKTNWWNYWTVSCANENDMVPSDYSIPNWGSSDLKMFYHMYPSYYSDGTNEKIVFVSKAQLSKDGDLLPGQYANRISILDYTSSGTATADTLWNLDYSSDKKYPVMMIKDNKNWVFWESNYEGKSSISFTTNDVDDYAGVVNGYSPEAKVRVPSAISSAGKPNVIDRDSSDNNIELIYTGVNKITGGTDVYMSQYSLNFNSGDKRSFGLSERANSLSRVFDQMKRDAKYNFYVAKGLAWVRQDMTGTVSKKNLPAVVIGLGGDPNSDTHNKYIDVFTGNTVNFNINDWRNGNTDNLPLFENLSPAGGSAYPKFSFDEATGVMTIEYDPNSDAYNELGKTLVDFSSGVIRFTKLKDLSETVDDAGSALYKKPVTVYASYVPQAISLTEGQGINDGGFATYDKDYGKVVVMWRKTGANTSNGIYYKIFEPRNDSENRLKYANIFEDKKVLTDSSVTNINENSISGFFDNITKGHNDGKGYGKLWLFWSGTKSGNNAIYCETEAIDENILY